MSGSSAENLNRLASVAITTLTEADTFPYDLDIGTPGIGIGCLNKDTGTVLIFNLVTLENNTIGPFRVPSTNPLSEEFPPFKRIELVQASTSFNLIIRGSWG